MLQQQPEILSEVIGSCQKFVTKQDGEIDEPTAKRQCTSPVEGALSQVTVEGCGLSDINGVYKQTDRTFHGAPEYSKEGIIWEEKWTTVEMYRLDGRWRIYIPGYDALYSAPVGDNPKMPPKDGWETHDSDGIHPVPKLKYH